MKNRKKILEAGVLLVLTGGILWHTISRERADYHIVMGTSDTFYEETYAELERYFEQFGRDLDGNGEVRVVFDRLKMDASVREQGPEFSYEDGIQLLKLATEIQVLKRSIYFLDTQILNLVRHYDEDFFCETISMKDVVSDKDNGVFDEEVLKDYWICVRSRDTFEKPDESGYSEDMELVEALWKGE